MSVLHVGLLTLFLLPSAGRALSVETNENTLIIKWGVSGDIPLPGDYDGDGKADVAVFRPSDGAWCILGSTGKSWTKSWGVVGDIPVPADYDGDGTMDLATWRPSDGTWRIFGSIGTSWTMAGGEKGDLPVPADYHGIGKAVMAFFRPQDGKWYINSPRDKLEFTAEWGSSEDIPVPGDYDGDGKADAATFRPSDAAFHITYTGGGTFVSDRNRPGDIPVPGDYNGDGIMDVAVWRPSDATLHIAFAGGGTETIAFGAPGDIPVPADYSGKGKTELAVFRPSDGTWRISDGGGSPGERERQQFNSHQWQTENGLPHNSVSTAIQTRDKYLWLGTPKGLVRFDGARFTVFNSQNTRELKDSAIRSLCETRDGTLWIAPEKGGLICLKKRMFAQNLSSDIRVTTLFESHDGVLWIGTTNGLLRYKDGRSTSFTKKDGLVDNQVLAISEDHNGHLWIGTSGGLSRYKDKFEENYTEKNGLPVNSVRALFCDRQDNLWIGTGGGGLVWFRQGHFINMRNGLSDRFISAIFGDSSGKLWVGTLSGLWHREGKRFVPDLNYEGTSYGTIFCMTEDTEGGLWLGTKEGLTLLQAKAFKTYKEQDISRNNVMSVCEDGKGTMWVATWGGGLSRLRNGKTVTYNRANSPLYDVLLSMCESRDGSLWLGGDFEGGLFQFKDGTFTRYGRPEGIIDSAIRVIYEDRRGGLWLGTSGALYLRQNGKFQRFTTADGLASNTIRAICEDDQGDLWIGTNDGLSRRNNGTFSNFTIRDGLSANQVRSIYEDRERNLWIGTEGGGLNRFKNGKFTAYTTKQGLFSDSISEVLEDDRGNLWMSCFSGVFRVKKKDLDDLDRGKVQTIPCASYGNGDGMSSVQCNGVSKPAGWRAKDGRLWFPTTRGVVVVDPNSIRENNSPPSVVVEDIIANKRKLSPSNGLTIPPGKGDLEFHYTALSFRAPQKNRFKYKLEGVDSDWVDAETRRVAYYNNIKPGEYAFRVIGCNNEGLWNEVGSNVTFTLLPHFWQTNWFLGLAALAATGGIAGVARYVTWRRVQGKLQRLEQQHAVEKERTRIAQDMHDDLGAHLTRITLLSELAQRDARVAEKVATHTAQISETARNLVQGMDEIVWAVNPHNDNLPRLVSYLFQYAEKFFSGTPVRCRFDRPTSLPNCPLRAEVRHNLFLATKEALNNALKHSSASEVWLRVSLTDSRMQILIEDNGRGISEERMREFGNGLANMKRRMEDVNGEFQLTSQPEKGTIVSIAIKI